MYFLCFICVFFLFFFFNDTATTEIYTLSLHDALPISPGDTSACAPTSTTTAGHQLSQWDANRYLRVAVTAANALGATTAWSPATPMVLMTPATPAAPTLRSYSGALQVVFPASVPFGAT